MATTTVTGMNATRGHLTPLCAICVSRPGILLTDIDGRGYPACVRCTRPARAEKRMIRRPGKRVYPVSPVRGRIVDYVRHNPGATSIEIREALGISTHDANAFSQKMVRLHRDGSLRREGEFPSYRYWITKAGMGLA